MMQGTKFAVPAQTNNLKSRRADHKKSPARHDKAGGEAHIVLVYH